MESKGEIFLHPRKHFSYSGARLWKYKVTIHPPDTSKRQLKLFLARYRLVYDCRYWIVSGKNGTRQVLHVPNVPPTLEHKLLLPTS